MKSTASVSVPATSGNIGPGFDVLGLALELRDVVTATMIDEPGVRVTIQGEGAGTLPTDQNHLVARVLLQGLNVLGVEVTGLDISCDNRIPQGRGLGSSAAAIVAGLSLAQVLATGAIDREWVLNQATEFEGHPDNAAACIFGGLTVAWATDEVHAKSLSVLPEVSAVVGIPSSELSTEKARGLLPSEVPLTDASFNIARSLLVIVGLTQDPSVLLDATQDRLHQPYRRDAYADSLDLVATLRSQGIASCISGAGPSVLALGASDSVIKAQQVIDEAGFISLALSVSPHGVMIHV